MTLVGVAEHRNGPSEPESVINGVTSYFIVGLLASVNWGVPANPLLLLIGGHLSIAAQS